MIAIGLSTDDERQGSTRFDWPLRPHSTLTTATPYSNHHTTQPVPPGEFGLLFTDGAKFGRAEQLHLALQGLWAFESAHGRPPQPNSDADAEEVRDRSSSSQQRGRLTCTCLVYIDWIHPSNKFSPGAAPDGEAERGAGQARVGAGAVG